MLRRARSFHAVSAALRLWSRLAHAVRNSLRQRVMWWSPKLSRPALLRPERSTPLAKPSPIGQYRWSHGLALGVGVFGVQRRGDAAVSVSDPQRAVSQWRCSQS
jgi:hypothetical protein